MIEKINQHNQHLSPCNLPSEKSPGQFSMTSPSNKLRITTDDGVKEGSISPDVVNLVDSKTNPIRILSTEPTNNSNNSHLICFLTIVIGNRLKKEGG